MLVLDDLEEENRGKILFVDFETNGFSSKSSSALSLFCKKSSGEEFERYYFPREEYNKHAIKVNGLEEDVLLEKRAGEEYPENMIDDHESIFEFSEDVNTFVSFNVKFDLQWMPEDFINMVESYAIKTVCPMVELTPIMKLPKKRGSGYKYPNLKEAAIFLGIEIDDSKQHDAKYDVEILEKVYYKAVAKYGI